MDLIRCVVSRRILALVATVLVVLGTVVGQTGVISTAYAQPIVSPSQTPNPTQDGESYGPITYQNIPCLQLPAQSAVDHATLTDAQLATYGLPPRSKAHSLASWLAAVRHATLRSCQMRTILDGGKPIKSDIVTATWAGWVDEPSGSVQAAEGDFWVPCIHPSTIWETASSWVGIGGIYGGNVVQAGTHEEHHSWPGGIEQYVYDAFIENAPNYGETQVFSVNCNDKMYVDVWDPNNMFIEDLSSGVYWSGTQGGAFGDNSMEWITEKDSSHNLADFNSDTFTDCWGEEYYNNFELIQSLNPVKFVAKRNGQQNGPQLMGVGSLVGDFNSGSQFTNTWIQGS